MYTPMAMSGNNRRGVALLAAMMLLVLCVGLSITMIDQCTANKRSQALRESDLQSYANAMSAANYALDYVATNATGTQIPVSPSAASVWVDLSGIPYGSPTSYTSPFVTAQHNGNSYNICPTINSSKVAYLKILSLAANQPYYTVYVDSEGFTNSNVIGLGTDVDKTMIRGVDANFKVTLPSAYTNFSGLAQGLYSNAAFSYKISVDYWNSNPSGTAPGVAYSGPPGSYYTSPLVSAFQGTPTQYGGGFTVYSTPNSGQSTIAPPTFSYTAPSASFGNVSGGASVPASQMSASGDLTGTVTLLAGQTYHFASISAAANISIDNGGVATNTDCKIYVDGAIGQMSTTTFSAGQNSTRMIMYQGDNAGASSFNGNTTTGVVNDPRRFIVVTAYSGQISMNGGSSFGGVLIAPNASLKLNGNNNFYGSAMMGSMGNINGHEFFHYDSQLANVSVPIPASSSGSGVQVALSGWRTR